MSGHPWNLTADPWGTPTPPPPPEPEGADAPGLLTLLDTQKDVLVGVARHEITYKDKEVDAAYKARARKIRRGLKVYAVDDPFPYRDLRDWYNFCSSKYSTWRDREQHLDDVLYPLVEAIESRQVEGIVDWATENPESWGVLDLRIEELRAEFAGATTLDTYQDVGRRSVEIIIGAVNLVWDPKMVPEGEETPRGDDAKGKFDFILRTAAPGKSHEELRQVLRAAWRLGHDTKHSGSASRLSAFCSAQAAVLIARSLREIEEQLKAAQA